MIVLLFIVAAIVSWLLGAFGVQARVSWDLLSKACCAIAVAVYLFAGARL